MCSSEIHYLVRSVYLLKDRTIPKNYEKLCSSALCKAFHLVHVPNLRALYLFSRFWAVHSVCGSHLCSQKMHEHVAAERSMLF